MCHLGPYSVHPFICKEIDFNLSEKSFFLYLRALNDTMAHIDGINIVLRDYLLNYDHHAFSIEDE